MWNDLLAALALILVMEGIFPFANPVGMRRVLARFSQMDDRSLRIMGFASMVLGVLVLYAVR